ncbi:MAG TPA: hypothetical protein VKF14_02960 [Candidatus Dormibacteraeota bacterium]|nr:hypothetical protein [Candidatus Dormibacteraeota bacterium]
MWVTDLVPLHAVWSIAVPIALTELLFRGRGTDPWLGRLGLLLASALFAIGAAGLWFSIYASQHHFVASWPQLLGTLVVVVLVGALAVQLPGRSRDAGRSASARAPSAWLVGVAMIGLVLGWCRRQDWGPPHHLALAAGALLTYAWNGFLTIPPGDRLDVAGQVVVDGLTVALVVVAAVRMPRDRTHPLSR